MRDHFHGYIPITVAKVLVLSIYRRILQEVQLYPVQSEWSSLAARRESRDGQPSRVTSSRYSAKRKARIWAHLYQVNYLFCAVYIYKMNE